MRTDLEGGLRLSHHTTLSRRILVQAILVLQNNGGSNGACIILYYRPIVAHDRITVVFCRAYMRMTSKPIWNYWKSYNIAPILSVSCGYQHHECGSTQEMLCL